MTHFLRLAPLAIKHDPRTGKDEPLHVGDVIEWRTWNEDGEYANRVKVASVDFAKLLTDKDWRWPVEVQG